MRLLLVLIAPLLVAGCTTSPATDPVHQESVPTQQAPAEVSPTSLPSPVPSASPMPSASPTPTIAPPPDARAQRSLATLRRLPRAPRISPGDTYDRDAFGSAWSDVDGNGCNQRDDVLLRDAVAGTTRVHLQGSCPHDVLAGVWIDPYTGRTIVLDDLKDLSQAQAIQIDHVVALSEAWVSGADAWTEQRRRRFANDLDGLLAVDGPTNASKSDTDPAGWRPRKAYQCSYAARWIDIKARWRLSADPSERRALREMLGYC